MLELQIQDILNSDIWFSSQWYISFRNHLQMKLASDVVKCCKLQEPLTTVVRADISGFRADQNDRVRGRSCEVLDAHASALDTMSTQVWVEQVTSSYRKYIGVCALPGLTRASAIGSIGCSFNGGGGRNGAYQQELQTDPSRCRWHPESTSVVCYTAMRASGHSSDTEDSGHWGCFVSCKLRIPFFDRDILQYKICKTMCDLLAEP